MFLFTAIEALSSKSLTQKKKNKDDVWEAYMRSYIELNKIRIEYYSRKLENLKK